MPFASAASTTRPPRSLRRPLNNPSTEQHRPEQLPLHCIAQYSATCKYHTFHTLTLHITPLHTLTPNPILHNTPNTHLQTALLTACSHLSETHIILQAPKQIANLPAQHTCNTPITMHTINHLPCAHQRDAGLTSAIPPLPTCLPLPPQPHTRTPRAVTQLTHCYASRYTLHSRLHLHTPTPQTNNL